MKRLLLILVVMTLAGRLSAAFGDWTNFLYVAVYGDSNYWTTLDIFDGADGSNAFNHPQGILATESNVFVIDTGNDRIVKLGYRRTVLFTPEPSNVWEMFYEGEWGSSGSGSNEFSHPTDASFGLDGLMYVIDSSNHCVKVCDTSGTFHNVIGSYGLTSNGFNLPTGICVVPTNGNLMIANYGNSNVLEYTSSGEFVRVLEVVPNYPNTPAIDDVHYELILGPYDVLVISSNLYITEAGRKNANQYKSKSRVKGANDANRFLLLNYDDFNYIADWNLPETNVDALIGGWTGNVMQGIRGLIDFDGFLLFACADNSQSQYVIADELGYIIGKFGTEVISGSVSPDNAVNHFAYPYNLARYSNFVFCCDSGNNRVTMWKENSLPVFDFPETNWFEVREMQVLAFTVHAVDEDDDIITYSGVLNPATDGKNWGVNSDYLKFSMIPYYGTAGTDYTLTLRASDGTASATMDVTIHVNPVNAKHKQLVKQKPFYYEDWVYDPADDGDLVKLKIKKSAAVNHWDGSVLTVSGSKKVGLQAKRSRKLAGGGHFYDRLYGELYATNKYALGSVAQLDVVEGEATLAKVATKGTVGRVIFPSGVAGAVIVKGGGLGGVDGDTLKKVSVSRAKIKNLATKEKRTTGGDISTRYYPGQYGQIRAAAAGKKGVAIGKVSATGGDITNVYIRGDGHIAGVSVKQGKDEFKLPVGGNLQSSAVRAGYNPFDHTVANEGDVDSVKTSANMENSAILGAGDPGQDSFQGTGVDPTETYLGSVKKLKHGKGAGIIDCLIVSKDPIKKIDKLNIDTNTTVIINGVVQ